MHIPGTCLNNALKKVPAGNIKEITFSIPDCSISLVAHCIIDITTTLYRAEKPSGVY